MDICDGLNESAYNKIIDHFHSATKNFEFCSMKAVEKEKKNKEQGRQNLKVSGSGKKRECRCVNATRLLLG